MYLDWEIEGNVKYMIRMGYSGEIYQEFCVCKIPNMLIAKVL